MTDRPLLVVLALVLGIVVGLSGADNAVADPLTDLVHPPRDPALLLPTPAPDPWLVPPTGFEDAHPGTVLRSRPVQVGPLLTPNTASQLMVRSTDSKGRPVPVVTTVIVPPKPSRTTIVWTSAKWNVHTGPSGGTHPGGDDHF